MRLAKIAIRRSADNGGLDLVCRICGETSRLHPDEGFVAQVRLFLSQHRHDRS